METPQLPAPKLRVKLPSKIILTTLAVGVVLSGAAFFGIPYFYEQHSASELLRTQVTGLELQLAGLQKQVSGVAIDQQMLSDQEAVNRQTIHQKSQDELLTASVAKLTPSVVSIVISKEVPNLSVVYQNPFGNDPLFKNFNLRVPVYQQHGTTQKKIGAGTGFIISTDGYILTNKHVVVDQTADYTVLLSDGSQKPATIIYRDVNNDVAIAKIEGSGYHAVSLGDSASLQLGQSVIAIGNALGEYNNSVSVGIVSGLNRSIKASGSGIGTEQLTGIIQTDAAINPGNSGGPLIDLTSKVVGINVATVVGSSNISFSIPINTVKSIIKQVIGR